MKQENQGKWRIVEMELWEQDFVDLVVQGYFDIRARGRGEFQFGAVHGFMDFRIESSGDSDQLVFSWTGTDEMDQVSGRGWAKLEKDRLEGRIFFHDGDDSGFQAVRMSKKGGKRKL